MEYQTPSFFKIVSQVKLLWNIDPSHGILNPFQWYIKPPSHGISNPYPWYFDSLSIKYQTSQIINYELSNTAMEY